jgi:pyrimidine-specific ribonucleoside hydrolase
MRKLFRWTTRWLLGGLFALLASATPNAKAGTVWIDTDLSIGSPLREVDDAYGLLLAFRSPELCVAGISTTYGNAPLGSTTRRTRDLFGRFGLTTAVNTGAASAKDLGRATAASDALAAALREDGRLTYIALGPLTNLATFLFLHPGQADRFEQVIMVAGKSAEATLGFGPRKRFQIHDANFVKDPAAVRVVLRSRIPILLAPIETSSRLLFNSRELHALEASGSAGSYLAQRSGMWLWFWMHFVHARGGPIFDALPVVAAVRPGLLTIEHRYARFDSGGNFIADRGPDESGREVQFCSAFAPATKDFILGRIAAWPNDQPMKSSSAPRDR